MNSGEAERRTRASEATRDHHDTPERRRIDGPATTPEGEGREVPPYDGQDRSRVLSIPVRAVRFARNIRPK
jgi:hypothetical protein